MGCGKSCIQREIYGFASIIQEEKVYINHIMAQLKILENEKQTELKVGRQNKINSAEIK